MNTRILSAVTVVVSGILFGFGLAVSTMIKPEVVLDFLRFSDFGLLLVLGGALAVALLAYPARALRSRSSGCAGSLVRRRLGNLRRVSRSRDSGFGCGQLALADRGGGDVVGRLCAGTFRPDGLGPTRWRTHRDGEAERDATQSRL